LKHAEIEATCEEDRAAEWAEAHSSHCTAFFWACERKKRCEKSSSTPQEQASKMIPGLASGTAGGLLFIGFPGVVCAKAELLSENAPAAIKIAAPSAKHLRRRFRNL